MSEYNFDGLIGPSHHFGGLAPGNLASMAHRLTLSRPRAAARQGLEKMGRLMRLGVPQGFFLPGETPRVECLREEGFSGSDMQVLESAARHAPDLFRAAYSASAMWTANLATVSPGADTADGRCHITPANLWTQRHRRWEAREGPSRLELTFPDRECFTRHEALPGEPRFADEGAANHLRLSPGCGAAGLEIFVVGFDPAEPARPSAFPARQSAAASERIIQQHQLSPERVRLVRQNPAAIDAGVFHNDVAAVSHEDLLLIHAEAWLSQREVLDDLQAAYQKLCGGQLIVREVSAAELPLDQAVATYVFNSQIVRGPDGGRVLLAPAECEGHPQARALIDRLKDTERLFTQVQFVDLSESMANGGGPACLRLRLELSEAQAAAVREGFILDEDRLAALETWVDWHYREHLAPKDLLDPSLLKDIRCALDELTRICGCGPVYAFQR